MKNIFSEDESASEFESSSVPSEDEIDSILKQVEQQEEEEQADEEYEEQQPQQAARKQMTKTKLNSAYSLSNNEMGVVQAAMVQLDQARLYEMILKHNLFEGVKANQTSLKNVEKELKDFILERLQILLGMKQEKKVSEAPPQKVKVELPFNDIEIDFLKALAFKGTKGESATQPASKVIESQGISSLKPLQQQQTVGLKKLAQSEPEEVEEDEDEEEYVPPKPSKPISKPVRQVSHPKPVQKKKGAQTIEDIAREDLEKMKNRKPAHKMSDEELMEANKQISTGRKKSSKALPMPDADALAMHYQMQQLRKPAGANNFMNILSQKMGFSTNQIQDVGDEE